MSRLRSNPIGQRPYLQNLVIFSIVVGAAFALGGPIQVILSGLYWCGRVGAGYQLHIFFALAATQVALFLWSQTNEAARKFYKASQFAALALCAFEGALLLIAYPQTATLGIGAYLLAVMFALAIQFFSSADAGVGFFENMRLRLNYTIVLGIFILVLSVIFSALIAQYFLYLSSAPLMTTRLIFVIAMGVILAIAGAWHLDWRWKHGSKLLTIASFPPFFVLLLALLRAKYPDVAYDSLSYKSFIPYQIADWRTARMAILDPAMLGTNFQEILNGVILIKATDYNPSLVSTWSYVSLFFILPFAIFIGASHSPIERLARAFATAVIACLTEPAVAQGTSYHEPFLVLAMTMSLLETFVWPILLAAALATKISAAAAVPLVFLYKFWPGIGLTWQNLIRQRGAIAIAVLLLGIFFFPQIDRNLEYTGRIFGLSAHLASITDPDGPTAKLKSGPALVEEPSRGGLLNKLVLSACNAFAMDLLCPLNDGTNVGFHVLPSSRAPFVGFVLALAGIYGCFVYRAAGPRVLAVCICYVASVLTFLYMFTQGRYFVVPSFILAVLVLCLADDERLGRIREEFTNMRAIFFGTIALSIIPIGDLMVGVYINDGWECRRNLLDRAGTYGHNRAKTDIDRFVSQLAADYRKSCPAPGLPPAIILDHSLITNSMAQQIKMLSPYLGVHRLFESRVPELNHRFFSVDPSRERNLPRALLAVITHNAETLKTYARSTSSQYEPCFENAEVKIYCSKILAPRGSQCAHPIHELPAQRAPGDMSRLMSK